MTNTDLVEAKINRQIADKISIGKSGITFQNAGEAFEMAKMMAASSLAVPKFLRGNPGACLGVISDALEWGLSPYALARQAYSVNDQLAYQSAVFMALVNLKAPLKTRPDIAFEGTGQEMRATVTAIFEDGAERQYQSPRIADISPKNSPLWKSDPGQQLSYYSLRAFARRWCPEVVFGFRDPDEIREAAMHDITPKPELSGPAPKTLDDFAAAAEVGTVLQDQSVSASPPTEAEKGGGAPTPPNPSAATDLFERSIAIEALLKLAADSDIDEEERMAEINRQWPVYTKKFGEDSNIHEWFATAEEVARGEMKEAAARKKLEAMG